MVERSGILFQMPRHSGPPPKGEVELCPDAWRFPVPPRRFTRSKQERRSISGDSFVQIQNRTSNNGQRRHFGFSTRFLFSSTARKSFDQLG